MTNAEWQTLAQRYSNPFITHGIEKSTLLDITMLIAHISELHQQVVVLREELAGAKATMLALTKLSGDLDIPFAVIDGLDSRDVLYVEDVVLEQGKTKRFSFRPYRPPGTDAPN